MKSRTGTGGRWATDDGLCPARDILLPAGRKATSIGKCLEAVMFRLGGRKNERLQRQSYRDGLHLWRATRSGSRKADMGLDGRYLYSCWIGPSSVIHLLGWICQNGNSITLFPPLLIHSQLGREMMMVRVQEESVLGRCPYGGEERKAEGWLQFGRTVINSQNPTSRSLCRP